MNEKKVSDRLKYIPKTLIDDSFGKVTASVFLDVRYEKDGNYPIKHRVTFQRKQKYYSCMDISLNDWETMLSVKNPRRKEIQVTKKLIVDSFEVITKAITDISNNEGFTFQSLDRRLSRGTQDSIFAAFDNRINELKEEGRIGSSTWYKCAKSSIEKFAQYKDLKFSDITVPWLKKYEIKLITEKKKRTTVSINLRALRAIMNSGLKDGIITQSQYPFSTKKNDGKFKIKEGEGRKIALSADKLKKVLDFTLNPDDEKWRALWVFSFFCQGVNVNDILRLKYHDIQGSFISYYRKKTISTDNNSSEIRAWITPEMQDIILKYGNKKKDPDNYIFPYLTHGISAEREKKIIQNVIHLINKRMKKIGTSLGIGSLTGYVARHSWASISRSGGVSPYAISKALGHKSLSTTMIYLDSLSDDEISTNAAIVSQMLKKTTKKSERKRQTVK